MFLFETTDKDGITIRLALKRWNLHIKAKHPDVGNFIE